MAELLNSLGWFRPISAEQLKTEAGVTALNNMLRILFENMASDGELVRIYRGYGAPENVVTANIGALFLRLDGSTSTTLYVKTADSGESTGWTAK